MSGPEESGPEESWPEEGAQQKPWPKSLVWALVGAAGCALAGALAAANTWTGLGATFTFRGLPAWAWGALNGALIGAQSGVVLALWGRVRRGRLSAPVGLGLVLVLPSALLAGAFMLVDAGSALALERGGALPGVGELPRVFRASLFYGCALIGALMSHVGTRSLWFGLFMSWITCMIFYTPIGALGVMALGDAPSEDFFWRGAFPYYLALPASWWVARQFGFDPLPVLEVED